MYNAGASPCLIAIRPSTAVSLPFSFLHALSSRAHSFCNTMLESKKALVSLMGEEVREASTNILQTLACAHTTALWVTHCPYGAHATLAGGFGGDGAQSGGADVWALT